jgi:hypothetical protein
MPKALVLLGAIIVTLESAGAQNFEVRERGPHHRVLERTVARAQGDGTTRNENERYVELASGMHYEVNGAWVESREEIEIINDTAVARHGAHQAVWSANANTAGAVTLISPDGQRFRSHVLGIAFTDRASGASVMLATIKDSIGVVVGANQVIYPDAFEGIKASIRYTYTRGGMEQDILLEEAPRAPNEYLAGMDSTTTSLQVYTEFIEAPPAAVQSHVRYQETDLQRRPVMAFPDIVDQALDFGLMHVGSGRAFLTGAEEKGELVQKEWVGLEGRQFLIESVDLTAIQPLLNTLPLTAGIEPQKKAQRSAKAPVPNIKNRHIARLLPTAPKGAESGNRMRLAGALPAGKAVVVDYSILNSSLTNYTFEAVETYLISGAVNLYGSSNVAEGGTVIKYTAGAGAKIDVKGNLRFDTDLYRPVVMTADTDGTMGESITSGSLNGADVALRFDYNTSGQLASVTNVKVLYAKTALEFAGGYGHEVRHAQLLNCGTAAHADGAEVRMRNILGWNVTNVLTGTSSSTSTGRWEQATLDQATNLISSATGFFTNCLLTGVVATNGLDGAGNTVLASSNGVYKSVGSGYHYLADGSSYRDAGTTNIDGGLRTELRLRTTHAPIALSAITANTILDPRASRETGTPDAGFYYAPLDYLACGVAVGSNVTVVLTNGAAVGIDYATNSWGFRLNSASFHSVGSPTDFNRTVRAHMSQEKSSGNPATRACFYDGESVGSSACELRLRFTEFSQLSYDGYMVFEGTKFRALEWTHDRIYNPWLVINASADNGPIVCGLTNSLWERAAVEISRSGAASSSIEVHLRNNLFRTRSLSFTGGSNTWTVKDNLFDRMTGLTDNGSAVSNSYNASFQTTYNLSGGASNIALTNLVYETGALGIYYQPTNSLLINAGSSGADLASLYHFTVLTNNVKETNSTIDIGLHYVATSGGVPIDSDGDGLADFLEDADGDGVLDSAEPNISLVDTDGDGVSDYLEWLQGRNPRASAANDTNGVVRLRVFTPLK